MSKNELKTKNPAQDAGGWDDETVLNFEILKERATELIGQLNTSDLSAMDEVLKTLTNLQKAQDMLLSSNLKFDSNKGLPDDATVEDIRELRNQIGRALDRIRETKAAAGLS